MGTHGKKLIENGSRLTDNDRQLIKDLRELIHHEDDILNYRMGWFSALHGLIFTGFGTIFPENLANLSKVKPLLAVMACTGALLSVIMISSLVGPSMGNDRMLTFWGNWLKKNRYKYNGPGLVSWHMKPEKRWAHYINPWNFVPVILLCSWLVTAYIVLFTL